MKRVKRRDVDCFWVTIPLPIGEAFLVFFGALAVSPLFSWALALLQNTLTLVFHLIVSTLYMAYAAARS